ncbi:MAG TPA: adenylate/guanylate cyclase domain-containing protein, partial [Desulfobacteria bacterium]|nr:adenylate/guanylate cyclase domain-containing protein [Desulfobacteria bacterium]
LWLTPTAPVLYIFLDYAVLTSANFIRAELGRRQTRSVLTRYVSRDVAEQLMRDPDKISLGGNRCEVTVMFCDIRDFTQYSENREPEKVVNLLNRYLSIMTKVIFSHGGTLDKYLGDGLMAVFGAPVHYSNHVQRAIQTAVKIIEEVERLNRRAALEGDPPMKIGIGINSGTVLVGNVGSPERMDYTVIGEEVNLASRLEGLTKVFNTPVIISERSVKRVEESGEKYNDLQFLGKAEVKGFTDPIGVYTVKDETAPQKGKQV